MVRKMTGWGTRGRPFSEKEFNRSYIKSRFTVKKYSEYLKHIARTMSSRNIRLKKALKAGMR